MANKRELGANRQAPVKTAQKPYKESGAQRTPKENSSRCSPEHDEEATDLLDSQDSSSCSKKASYCQTNPLNPYRAAQSPGEDEDDDDDDNDDNEDDDDDDGDEDVEEESCARKASLKVSKCCHDHSTSDKTRQQSYRVYDSMPANQTKQGAANRKPAEDKSSHQACRNNQQPPKKK